MGLVPATRLTFPSMLLPCLGITDKRRKARLDKQGKMTRVTDFNLVDEAGERALCDAYGNNVAFKCPKCGHPMLAIILPKQNRRGSTPENEAECRNCEFRAWVVAEPAQKLLRLQSKD